MSFACGNALCIEAVNASLALLIFMIRLLDCVHFNCCLLTLAGARKNVISRWSRPVRSYRYCDTNLYSQSCFIPIALADMK